MKASNWITDKNEKTYLWIIWSVFSFLIAYIACYHEPWFDEYHVWFMCKHLKLTWLWSSMMREGHFILWHLLIYPFVKFGCSYWCLQFVGGILTSAAVWFLLMKSPFDILSKTIITFSYPLLYLFPVISRCYALIPLFLFITAWLYTIQQKHMYLYCLFVGLIAHTHAYMEGLVGILFLLFCYEQIYIPYRRKEDVSKAIKAACITIGVVVLAFLQVAGSLQYANDNFTERNNNIKEVLEGLFFFTTSKELFIIPGNWHQLFPNSIVFSRLYGLAYLLLWSFTFFNIILIFLKIKINKKYILVFLVAVGWQIIMALFVYGFGHQRLFLPIIILFFILWISYNTKVKNNVRAIIICIFFMTAGHINILNDINGLFCEDTDLQKYVEKEIPHNEILYFTAYYMKSIEMDLYNNYNIHFLTESTNVSSPRFLSEELLNSIFSNCNQPTTIYIFTDKMYQNRIGEYHLTMLTNIGKYYIYKTICLSNMTQERNKPIKRR